MYFIMVGSRMKDGNDLGTYIKDRGFTEASLLSMSLRLR